MIADAQRRWVADAMGQVTRQHLLPAAADHWPELHSYRISCRTGSGRATYCKQLSQGYVITYGRQMVGDKFSAEDCQGWLTGREIMERGYFDGQLSPVNLLTHTLCHEFAHILQFLGEPGRRINQRSHTARFYRELDAIHQLGIAVLAREKLLARLVQRLDQALLCGELQPAAIIKPSLGATVYFKHQQLTLSGKVLRRNRHTMTIEVSNGQRRSHWRVPYHLARLQG